MVVGRVQPVVECPGHAARLPFHVGHAAVACVEHLTLVGDAIAVGIGQLVEIPIVGLEREEFAVAEWKANARQHQFVGEHRVLVVDAVAVGVLVPGNPADRLAGVRAVGVAHVGAHLEHVHTTVAVERDPDGILNQRIGEYRLDSESGRELEVLLLVGGIEPLDRRLLAEVGAAVDLRLRWVRCLARRRLPGGSSLGRNNGGAEHAGRSVHCQTPGNHVHHGEYLDSRIERRDRPAGFPQTASTVIDFLGHGVSGRLR
jgi:hypothetical protein